jgi:methyl-accepting chemotaxis protein
METLGLFVRDLILSLASLLKEESTPGIVSLFLFASGAAAILMIVRDMSSRRRVLKAVSRKVRSLDKETFATSGFDEVTEWINKGLKGARRAREPLQEAWEEFEETLTVDDRFDPPTRRNTVRPSFFFNIEDLGYGSGFYKFLPGLFVSIGLALTFLGLIAVLQGMQVINDETMLVLLDLASAKFIMSLSGLACSIIIIIVLKSQVGGVDRDLHHLVRMLERRFDFVSLETLGFEQLRVQREAQAANQKLATELVADLGRPLREELPQAISASIRENMAPVLEQLSKQGTDSVSTMASDLSQQITDGLGESLAAASASMAQAGDRIAQLADRMDNSSGRMGSEMEGAVARVAQAVDDLRSAMSDTAQQTGGAFTQGAEQLLSVMNQTLDGIRSNTGESARAMSAAAEEMTAAARTMKEEMEGAAKAGSEAARGRMEESGNEVGAAITSAGVSVAGTYEAAASRIADLAQSLSDQTGKDLIGPLREIEERLKGMVTTLDDGVRRMQGFAHAVGEGAQAGNAAADTFRTAAQDLVEASGPVRASVEEMQRSTRSLGEGVERASKAVVVSSEEVARSAARTLEAAGETIGGEQRAIATVVNAIEGLVRQMQGQGDRIDDIDEKLGGALELYASSTEKSMQSIRTHVQEMASELNAALDSLRAIVDSLQQFEPQQERRRV